MGARGLLLTLVALSILISVVRPATCSPNQQAYERSGIATFYTKYSRGACYGVQRPRDGLFAAASPQLFKRGAACGKRVKVTCVGKGCILPGASGKIVPGSNSGGPITVTIVELCSSCKPSQFALSLTAFSHLADPDLGSIRIRYKFV